MGITRGGVASLIAISLLGFGALMLPDRPNGLSISAVAATTGVANKFQHPLGPGIFTERLTGGNGWYVSADFGTPLGVACRRLKSAICFNLGEDWRHESRTLGRPVYAVANGEVLDFGYASRPAGKLPHSLGNYILIKHTLPSQGRSIPRVGLVRTVVSLYAHLSDLKGLCGNDSVSCRKGQPVGIGALIGHVGETGATNGASLHFEMRLTEEKCFDRPGQTTENESCLKYAKDRYPVRYARGGGWVDPTCFIENASAPSNDMIARAARIEVDDTLRGDNLCATKEIDEPNHAGKKIDSYGLNADGKSVWWKFTAPESIEYTVSTIGSQFDTALGVYLEAQSGALWPVAQNGNEHAKLCDVASYCTSKVTFAAVAGRTYYFAVDGAATKTISAASGPILLTVAKAGASLFVTPRETSFQPGFEGGPFTPSSVNFQVSASDGVVAYSISNLPAWLTPSTTFGKANTFSRFIDFSVNDNANSLEPGIHQAAIVFGNSTGKPQVRTVTLRVKALPSLEVAPKANIGASGVVRGPFGPASFLYRINATAGKISYRVLRVPSWLTVSSSSGTATTTPTWLRFTVNSSASSLPIGTYAEKIILRNNTNDRGTTTISAVLKVNPESRLIVGPLTGMATSGAAGGPFNRLSFLYKLRASAGRITYRVLGVPNWLTASSSSGISTTTISVLTFALNSKANAMPVGTYTATITFRDLTNGKDQTRSARLIVGSGANGYLLDRKGGYLLTQNGNKIVAR